MTKTTSSFDDSALDQLYKFYDESLIPFYREHPSLPKIREAKRYSMPIAIGSYSNREERSNSAYDNIGLQHNVKFKEDVIEGQPKSILKNS